MPAEMIERVSLAFNIPMCKTVIIGEKQAATAQLLLDSGDRCAEFARSSRSTLPPLTQPEQCSSLDEQCIRRDWPVAVQIRMVRLIISSRRNEALQQKRRAK